MATKSLGIKKNFPRVKEAREALRERAIEILESYLALSAEARTSNRPDVAEKILWNLIEHMPKGDDGERMIDESAAKPKQIEGRGGPTIQIGFKLGGIDDKKLPTIDVVPLKEIE